MAATSILGASSGAARGASLAIIWGYMNAVIGGMAFVFSLATVVLVIFVGRRARGNRVVGLIPEYRHRSRLGEPAGHCRCGGDRKLAERRVSREAL